MYAQHQHPYNGGSMQQRYGSHFAGGPALGMGDGGGQQQYGRYGDPYGGPADGQSGSSGQWGQGGQYSGQSGGSQYGGPSGSQFGQSGGQQGQFGPSGQGGQWGQSGQLAQLAHLGQSGPSGQWSGSPGWQQQQQQFQGERGQRTDVSFNQRTMDKDYNLISVLYHALQGVETCQRYCQDAQREGSPEVAQFMEQLQQQQQQIAQRAKEMLFRQRQI